MPEPKMSSLVENLEKAAEVNERLEELIREAHSTIKAMRQTERDVMHSLKQQVDAYATEALRPMLEAMAVEIQDKLSEVTEHVMSEFKKVTNPILKSIDMVEDYQQQGSFFDRGR